MKINQAIILAGGIGSRTKTRVYDNNTPKVMFRINDKPILQNILEIIHDKLKINSIIVVISKGDNQIRNYFGNGNNFGITIDYVESDSNLGIADALYLVKEKIHGTFLVMLGDEFYINSNHFTIINKKYDDAEAVITFTNTDNPQDIANNYSIKVDSAMRVKSLIEKPKTFENNMLGLGTFIFKNSIFDYIQKAPKSIRTKRKELIDVISILAKEKLVYAHKLNSSYVNINTVDDWKHAKYLYNKTHFNSYRKSLVIPSYNEVESLPFVINDFKDMVDEIIVADGGSSDGTIEKISNFENDINLKIIQSKFVGYGEALRNGIDKATGDIVILVEGDATFRSRDIYKMYEYIKDCDMVIGTRTTKELISQAANMSTGLRIANLLVAKFIELLWIKIEPRLTDVGCTYRTFWKSEYDEIKQNFIGLGPEFSPEMIIEFLRNDKRVIEIPVSYYGRIGGASKHSENFSAIFKTGLKMLSLILKKKFASPKLTPD